MRRNFLALLCILRGLELRWARFRLFEVLLSLLFFVSEVKKFPRECPLGWSSSRFFPLESGITRLPTVFVFFIKKTRACRSDSRCRVLFDTCAGYLRPWKKFNEAGYNRTFQTGYLTYVSSENSTSRTIAISSKQENTFFFCPSPESIRKFGPVLFFMTYK